MGTGATAGHSGRVHPSEPGPDAATVRAIDRIVAGATERLEAHPALRPVLDGLEGLLRELVQRWSLTLGEEYDEGLGAPVVAVETDGEPAVLKLAPPGPAFDAQVAVLEAARGRGYAAVLASDAARGAVLLERLGPSLAAAGLRPHVQVDHLTPALRLAWQVPLEVAPPVPPGRGKAVELAGIIDRFRTEDDEPRWGRALDRARDLALALHETRDPARDVLCHGDPHPGNALRSTGIPSYVLVDPDGFRCEPEYDVGVALRDFSRDLLALGDRTAARVLHHSLCEQAATATSTDALRVAQWAFVERVTTGLYLRWFDDQPASRSFLDSAALLTD